MKPFLVASLGLLLLVGQTNTLLQAASPIPVSRVEKQADGVLLHMQPGLLKIEVCTDRIIRVIYAPTDTLPVPENFVVINKWTPVHFELKENPGNITISTGKVTVQVDRATGQVQFLNAQGRPFLQEAAGGGKTMASTTLGGEPSYQAEQTFSSPVDERLYGLGQYQDGLWDWRGIPLELRQLNTQIAIPVLISNKGYGLLWDNASRTDFNPPGKPIPIAADDKTADTRSQGPTATEQLTAAAGKPIPKGPGRHGTFTTGAAGDYVFSTRDGDRRNDMAILVDGVQIAGVTNLWTPRSVVGKITLPANKTCEVTVRGGGNDVKLFARPLGDTTTFRSDFGNAIDYTVFYGPKLDDVIAGYRVATGQAPLWPKWAYGFWQCRERYSSQKQLLDTAAEFRKRQIPMDLIVQDWQYWGNHGWGSYEWDESHYPNPADLIKGLHDLNVKFMISVWCNPHGVTLNDLRANHMIVGDWIDVFDPKGRDIRWKHINDAFFSVGTDAWWGDATEPGDPGTDLLGKKLSTGPGDGVTSAYPLFASQSLYEGQRATDPKKRVCILTRSAFAGQQRYGASSWSGDINGNWQTLQRQIPAGLNFCLTGIPYWTTDCGGFFRPGDEYKSTDYNELLTRWYEWSTFCPILRIHGYQTETEIWKWLPETQTNLLAYDRLRYRMLPYNYTVASQVTLAGSTIMRALGMDFPDDAKVWTIPDEYMFGPAFLVAPVTEAKATNRTVYLPAGTSWVNFWTGETQPSGQKIAVAAPVETLPLFVRAGSIVPLGPNLQYANEKPANPIELRIYPGADGAFTLYEDEGDSYRYEKGAYATIPITWNDKARTLTIGARQGTFPGMLNERTFRIVLVSPGHGTGIEPAARGGEVSYKGARMAVPLFLSNQ